MREALDRGATPTALRALITEHCEGVYSFPMLTEAACQMLVDEVDAYAASGLPSARPNSMNKYGLVLNEIGLEPTFDALQRGVLQPVAAALFPEEGCSLDRHHTFIVQYEEGKDLGLDMHTDNSDVTFNVCLGREFEGAGLTFCGYMGAAGHRNFTYRHAQVTGLCLVHLGRRRHGADDLTSGERLNLIIWNTNLAHRSSNAYLELQRQHRYEREAGPPDLVCLSYTHDRDYLQYKEKPSAHAKMTRRAWCPPKFAAHDAPAADASCMVCVDSGGGGDDGAGAVPLRTGGAPQPRDDDFGAGSVGVDMAGEATLADAQDLQRVMASMLAGGDGAGVAEDDKLASTAELEAQVAGLYQEGHLL